MYVMTKETRLNLRITAPFREQLELLATYHGLTLSSYAHSVLVKAIRKEMSEVDLSGIRSQEKINGTKLAPHSKRAMKIYKPVSEERDRKRKSG